MTKQFEKLLLAALVKEKEFLNVIINYIDRDIFQNSYYAYFFSIINDYYNLSQKVITYDIFAHYFTKAYLENFSKEESPIVSQLAVEIFNTPYDLAFLKDELNSYVRGTKTRKALSKSLEDFDPDNIDQIVQDVTKASEDLVDDAPVEYVDSLGKREVRVDRVGTGIARLDMSLDGGLSRGELGILVAETGKGKSLGLLNFAWAAVLFGKTVLFITLEDSGDMVLKKFDSIFSGYEFITIRKDPTLMTKLRQKFSQHKNKLYVQDFTSGQGTISRIKAAINRVKGVELVIVDYIDEIATGNKRKDRWQEVEDAARELKGLAKDLDIPIWTATQTAAKSWGKENVGMGDTYGGKGKMHIAHIVLIICQTDEEFKNGILRLVVAKQKAGPKGAVINCKTDFERMRIYDTGM